MRFDGQHGVSGAAADAVPDTETGVVPGGVPSTRDGHGSASTTGQGPVAAGATGTGSESTEAMDEDDKRPGRRVSARRVAHQTGVVVNGVRSKVASLVWLVALLCAVVLALAAILVALDANPDNGIVSVVNDLAHRVDGPFWDMFTFSGKNAATKQVLVNWGIGAIGYLVVGRVLERIIRP